MCTLILFALDFNQGDKNEAFGVNFVKKVPQAWFKLSLPQLLSENYVNLQKSGCTDQSPVLPVSFAWFWQESRTHLQQKSPLKTARGGSQDNLGATALQ